MTEASGRRTERTPRPAPLDAATRARLRRQRRRDTKPELALRSALHRRGFRFRVDRPLPGTRRRVDITFVRARIAVFVDGCFWHRCPEHGTIPKNNREWWSTKLAGNVARDRATDDALAEQGWTVIRVWEHEDPMTAADHIASQVRTRRRSR